MSGLPPSVQRRVRAVQISAFWAGLAALLAGFIGGSVEPRPFLAGYLAGYLFWTGLSLGCLALALLQHQVGGAWSALTRRILEAGMMTLPLMAVLFLPILAGLGTLYPWARPASLRTNPSLAHLASYLNPAAFTARAVLYFLCWIALAGVLRRDSRTADRALDPAAEPTRARRLSGPGLLLYFVTMFFAAVDWILSLDAPWTSTIVGLIPVAGQALSAFALALVVLAFLSDAPELAAQTTPGLLRDLGNLLLTTVLLWGYLSYSQYLIFWSGDLPREVGWVAQRSAPGWGGIALVLLAGHLALPIVLLLFRAVKHNLRVLAALAAGLLLMRLLDAHWQILPSVDPERPAPRWTQIAAALGMGGLWIALFLRHLQAAPLLARRTTDRRAEWKEARSHG